MTVVDERTDIEVTVDTAKDAVLPCSYIERHDGAPPRATHYAFATCGHHKYLCTGCAEWTLRILALGATIICSEHRRPVDVSVTITPLA